MHRYTSYLTKLTTLPVQQTFKAHFYVETHKLGKLTTVTNLI